MVTIKFSTIGNLPISFLYNGILYSLKKSDEDAVINLYAPGARDVLMNEWHLPLTILGRVTSQDLLAGYIEVEPNTQESQNILADAARKKYGVKFLMETFPSPYDLPHGKLGEMKVIGYELVDSRFMTDIEKR